MFRVVAALAAASVLGCLASDVLAQGRSPNELRIVGSSTVFPFATAVGEAVDRGTDYRVIISEEGSGGGLELFCGGIGLEHPDIANASRAIKESEIKRCQQNGVIDVTEVMFGYDGIVLAHANAAPDFALSLGELFLALARTVPVDGAWVDNPHTRWSDINPRLPADEIRVLGPPPTSGTRDAFVELAMETGCESFPETAELEEESRGAICAALREDGHFVEAGENDNLIVQQLAADPRALGIFGFSFLDQNRDRVKPVAIDGVAPTFEAIESGDYPISRSLYFYVKNAHRPVVPAIAVYLDEFTGPSAMGFDGYLIEKGLIPLPEETAARIREAALAGTNSLAVTADEPASAAE